MEIGSIQLSNIQMPFLLLLAPLQFGTFPFPLCVAKDVSRQRLTQTATLKTLLFLVECSGCGAPLQSIDPLEPGYFIPNSKSLKEKPISKRKGGRSFIPTTDELTHLKQELAQSKSITDPDAIEMELLDDELYNIASGQDKNVPTRQVCKRCYSLKHYNTLIPVQVPLSSEILNEFLLPLKTQQVLILLVIDMFDIGGTIVDNFDQYVGSDNQVLLVVNKIDLLPTGAQEGRVKGWIKRYIKHKHPKLFKKLKGIQLISARSGYGVSGILKTIDTMNTTRRDIFIVGCTNVGKSTFVNRLLPKSASQITTSRVHGTTLANIYVPYTRQPGVFLVDTPGIASERVMKSAVGVEPVKKVKSTTVRLRRGKSVFFGALSRIDYLEGDPASIYITLFAAFDISIHITKTENADQVFAKHAGTLLSPPQKSDTSEELNLTLVPRKFSLEGTQWKDSLCDVVLPGIGWVALNATGKFEINAHSLENTTTYIREPLMPFEMRETVDIWKQR